MSSFRLFRMSVENEAPYDSVLEAVRRINYDGIPRTVYRDGKIMKWDWELPSDE